MRREFLIKLFIFSSIFVLSVDTLYKYYHGITYLKREDCILYAILPKWAFILFEHFIELILIVVVAIFAAAIIEKYFIRLKKFIPKNTLSAFIYASVIPVCSCSAIPLVPAMKDKLPFRAIITFVVAAPLLNPYIIMLSVTVLGLRYALVRIFCSFILAVASGYIAEMLYRRMKHQELGVWNGCHTRENCMAEGKSVYEDTFMIFKKIFPFLIVAGVLSAVFDQFVPRHLFDNYDLSNHFLGTGLVILIGVPVYFCNGADVLFLQPLLQYSHLPLGTAMAFSLTSTSVCISSLILLIKFIGKKLTLTILASVVIITFLLSLGIQLISMV
ncbi:MAG: permease [Gemmatimonadota bacterium]|nr:MAG: permease [Gemmatimonadota bacterium]